MTEFDVKLPAGFLAEVLAASILGGHLGGRTEGHDLVDDDDLRVEVKSCSLRPARDPEFLELSAPEKFPGPCDALLLVTTSGVEERATASVRMADDGLLSVTVSAEATRKRDRIRAYRLERNGFEHIHEHRRAKKPDGTFQVTWRVPIARCEELDLSPSRRD